MAVIAADVASANPEAAIGLVMSARIVPGFFLAPVAGVLVDRWDRKKVMVACDLGRASVLALLPFVDSVLGIVVASLLLEVLTLLWAPAKEASVPKLVPAEHLTRANSLSIGAAYGTFPFASLLFSGLAALGARLGEIDALAIFQFDRKGTAALYADVLTFLVSAAVIATLPVGRDGDSRRPARGDWTRTFHELKEGWQYIFLTPTVRAVNLGLAVALVGGGMLVPLGPVFAREVLESDDAGFGLLITALGFGVAGGVVALSTAQRRLPKERLFTAMVFIAGGSLVVGASVSTLAMAALAVFVLGACAGSVYVLGFTILHENVEDHLRGRIFSALYTLVRLCVLLAFALGPFLSAALGNLSSSLFGGEIGIGGVSVAVPGVRLTLWAAGAIILAAGAIALHAVKRNGAAGRDGELGGSRR